MRVQFNEGQEVVRQDLNTLQIMKEREFYDRFLYELLVRDEDGFFNGSFAVTRTDSNTISVAAGLGFQSDGTQVSPEATKRPVYLASAESIDITAAHASLNRIDIVCVKADRAVTDTETRRYKSTIQALPSDQSFDVETDWAADVIITAGTASGSPVAPSTPAGYLRIASIAVTAVTGIVNQAAITDERDVFDPIDLSYNRTFTGINTLEKQLVLKEYAAASVATPAADHVAVFLDTDNILKTKNEAGLVRPVSGSPEYDAIVGSTASATHSTLALALAAASAGWKILVLESFSVNTMITITLANIEIVLKPGVVISKGSATTGLSVTGAGTRIRGGKISGFSGGSDVAILVNSGATSAMLRDIRFASNTTDVDDANELASIIGCVNE